MWRRLNNGSKTMRGLKMNHEERFMNNINLIAEYIVKIADRHDAMLHTMLRIACALERLTPPPMEIK